MAMSAPSPSVVWLNIADGVPVPNVLVIGLSLVPNKAFVTVSAGGVPVMAPCRRNDTVLGVGTVVPLARNKSAPVTPLGNAPPVTVTRARFNMVNEATGPTGVFALLGPVK